MVLFAKSLNIPKSSSEAVNRKTTDNTKVKRKRTNWYTMVDKVRTRQKKSLDNTNLTKTRSDIRCSGMISISVLLVLIKIFILAVLLWKVLDNLFVITIHKFGIWWIVIAILSLMCNKQIHPQLLIVWKWYFFLWRG
jgi:hypothetical protein